MYMAIRTRKTRTRKTRTCRKHSAKKRKATRRRQGGMFRLYSQDNLPNASKMGRYDTMAIPVRSDPRNLGVVADAGVASIHEDNVYANARFDNGSPEEKLQEFYRDLKTQEFPFEKEALEHIFIEYPNFNVNVKDRVEQTILDVAIEERMPQLVERIVNHPTIQVATLQQGLETIYRMKQPTLTILRCKQLISDKLREKLSR